VRKSFGGFEVLHGRVDPDSRDGAFVVLVGPSGLRQIDLVADARGASKNITSGHDFHRRPAWSTMCSPKERDIAMVFQNYALYPHMTVCRQHGVFSLKLRGAKRRRNQQRAWPVPPKFWP